VSEEPPVTHTSDPRLLRRLYAVDLTVEDITTTRSATPHLPPVIGLTGYARSGKDTVAAFLVERYGYTRLAFADILRTFASTLNPLVPLEGDRVFARLADLVDGVGWDTAKTSVPEVRRLLQRLGTECGRALLGDTVWIDAAFRQMEPDRHYVISDVRFPNEVEAIRAHDPRNNMILRLVRPGVGPVNNHPSEAELRTEHRLFTVELHNTGTINDLHAMVRDVFENLLGFEEPQ
jgi:hypothetical protein